MISSQAHRSMRPLAAAHARLAVHFFGSVELHVDGSNLTAEAGAKSMALLAYLAVAAPLPVARERLTGILWADKAEDAARYRLRHALWDLRKLLDKQHLQANDTTCWLDGEDLWSDVIEFQKGCVMLRIDRRHGESAPADVLALQTLAELYRGDFFGRLTVREAPLFEEWCLAARERFELLYHEVLWRLAQAYQAAGDETSCVQTLVRLIDADPLRERSYRALIHAHLRQHDRAAALRVYKQCVLCLERELGVPPSPETEELYQSMINGAPTSARAHLDVAMHALKLGRYEEALKTCAAAEALAVDVHLRSEIMLLRAEIALARGRSSEALSLIQTARQALRQLVGK